MPIFNEKKINVVDVGIEKHTGGGISRYCYVVSTNRDLKTDVVVRDLLKLPGIQRVRLR